MIGYPLDSQVTFDEHGVPQFDRAITSDPLRQLYSKLFSDGVAPNPSTSMQVVTGTGMQVVVSEGFAICNGCLKLNEANYPIDVPPNATAEPREDTLVLQFNRDERICDFVYHVGTPMPQALIRNANVWEIMLAKIYVRSGSLGYIPTSDITDTRLNSELCGYISSVSKFDTTTLYNQIQADLEDFRNVSKAEFTSWLTNLQDMLDGNAEANMSNKILEIESRFSANNEKIYFDYKDGKYGFNTDPMRGADTFRPFNTLKTNVIFTSVATAATTSSSNGEEEKSVTYNSDYCTIRKTTSTDKPNPSYGEGAMYVPTGRYRSTYACTFLKRAHCTITALVYGLSSSDFDAYSFVVDGATKDAMFPAIMKAGETIVSCVFEKEFEAGDEIFFSSNSYEPISITVATD